MVRGQLEGGREQISQLHIFGRKCFPDISRNSIIAKCCLEISRPEFVSTNRSCRAVMNILQQFWFHFHGCHLSYNLMLGVTEELVLSLQRTYHWVPSSGSLGAGLGLSVALCRSSALTGAFGAQGSVWATFKRDLFPHQWCHRSRKLKYRNGRRHFFILRCV